MDENRQYCKQNTFTGNASDDSSFTFFPWLENRKRKSRLGRHGGRSRILQEINQNRENTEEDSKHQASDDKDGISFDYAKPSDIHDVGFVKSHDIYDLSLFKFNSSSEPNEAMKSTPPDEMSNQYGVCESPLNLDTKRFARLHTVYDPHPFRMDSSPKSVPIANCCSMLQDEILNQRISGSSQNHEVDRFALNETYNRSILKPELIHDATGDFLLRDEISSQCASRSENRDLDRFMNWYDGYDLSIKADSIRKNDESVSTDDISNQQSTSRSLRIPQRNEFAKLSDTYEFNCMIPDVDSKKMCVSSLHKDNPNELSAPNLLDSGNNQCATDAYDLSMKKTDTVREDCRDSLMQNEISDKQCSRSPHNSVVGDSVKPEVYDQSDQPIKTETFTGNASDDSLNTFPFPWFTDYPKRKSRLGRHGRSSRVLQEISQNLEHTEEDNQMSNDPVKSITEKDNRVPDDPVKCVAPNQSTQPISEIDQCPKIPESPAIDVPDHPACSIETHSCPETPESEAPPVKSTVKSDAGEFKLPEPVPPPKKDDFQFEVPLPPSNNRNQDKFPSCITIKGKTYHIRKVLGTGGSSMVYEVLDPATNKILAVKQVTLSDVDRCIADGYIKEVELLNKLQKCDCIIKMYDHEILAKSNSLTVLNVVMEKGDIDLAGVLKNCHKDQKKLSIDEKIRYWIAMLSAVDEIHKEGVIHSDLKPANFLIVDGKLKLIDFGIASCIQADMTSAGKDVFTGTLNYMSPEAMHFHPGRQVYRITFKSDIWSLGCILYHLLYGRLPFQHFQRKWEKIQAIVSPKVEIEFPKVEGVPSDLMIALKSCLDRNPERRMPIEDLLRISRSCLQKL